MKPFKTVNRIWKFCQNYLFTIPEEADMTYDIYCYKSDGFAPDLNEAKHVTSMEYQDGASSASSNFLKVFFSLRKINPELDYCFMEGYNKLKTNRNKNPEHIILNSPKGEFATQITVLNNCVLFSVPYWYSDTRANDVIRQVEEYVKIMRQALCYYVYDPQAQKAYDPWYEAFDTLPFYRSIYEETVRDTTEERKLHQAGSYITRYQNTGSGS